MATDKAELLQSLRIERSDVAPQGATQRRLPAWTTIPLALIAAVGLLGLFTLPISLNQQDDRVSAIQASPVPPPAAIEQRPRGLVASGYVIARRKATVAAEITGKVVEVLIDEGVVVRKGDVVARLDSVLAERDLALAQSRVDAAEAAIGAIEADLRDAERIWNRNQNLALHNVVSEADLTKAEARVGVLRAQLKQSEAQLATAKLEEKRTAEVLEKHRIRAPFGGVVVERNAQPGEMISPASVGGFTRTGICTIVDMESIEIEVDVNEAFIGRVHPGMAVSAVLDAYPDWAIPASVIGIVPTANREKATVKVRIGIKEMPQPNASVATPAAPRATSTLEAPPPPVQSPAGQHLSTTETAALVTRGDAFLSAGDIASARLFYERAASVGNSGAALRLGATFDPNFLGRTGVHGRSLPTAGNPPPSVAPPQPAPQSAAALPPKPQAASAVPTPAPWRPEQRDARILPDMAVKVTFDDIGAQAERSAAVN